MSATSLRFRLLASAGAILLLFLLLTGLALDRALDDYSHRAESDRLRGLIYSLLGAAEIHPDGAVTIALDRVPAPRLQRPGSGLDAALFDADGKILWQSPSSLGAPPPARFPGVDRWRFHEPPGFGLSYGLEWLTGDEPEPIRRFTIRVTDSDSPLLRETARLSHRLWFWLAVISALLLAALAALMQWGLKPLRAIRRHLDDIRNGQRQRLELEVPNEIQPLTQSLNELIEHQGRQKQRFRNALADLAHSLKTPLAVMRNHPAASEPQLAAQLTRIDEIIGHQLKRAATGGSSGFLTPTRVRPILERLARVLTRVYAEKGLRFDDRVGADFTLRIGEDDLMELCGNLLDNAAKYGRSQVVMHDRNGALLIDDDGPGFPADAAKLLQRGRRADNRAPGQGIGLAVADDIVRANGLEIELTRSELGGGRVIVRPAA